MGSQTWTRGSWDWSAEQGWAVRVRTKKLFDSPRHGSYRFDTIYTTPKVSLAFYKITYCFTKKYLCQSVPLASLFKWSPSLPPTIVSMITAWDKLEVNSEEEGQSDSVLKWQLTSTQRGFKDGDGDCDNLMLFQSQKLCSAEQGNIRIWMLHIVNKTKSLKYLLVYIGVIFST